MNRPEAIGILVVFAAAAGFGIWLTLSQVWAKQRVPSRLDEKLRRLQSEVTEPAQSQALRLWYVANPPSWAPDLGEPQLTLPAALLRVAPGTVIPVNGDPRQFDFDTIGGRIRLFDRGRLELARRGVRGVYSPPRPSDWLQHDPDALFDWPTTPPSSRVFDQHNPRPWAHG